MELNNNLLILKVTFLENYKFRQVNRMKKGIHPQYRPVVFQDASCDFAVLTRSTIKTEDTIVWEDGNTYPLVKLEISSGSHPFFTGKQKLIDTAGRVEKFNRKYAKAKK